MSKHSGHYTYRYGRRRPKVRYSYDEAMMTCRELQALYGGVFVIYSCLDCDYYHVGNQITKRRYRPESSEGLYQAFADMTAAFLRGKTTPPIETMLRRDTILKKDLQSPGS